MTGHGAVHLATADPKADRATDVRIPAGPKVETMVGRGTVVLKGVAQRTVIETGMKAAAIGVTQNRAVMQIAGRQRLAVRATTRRTAPGHGDLAVQAAVACGGQWLARPAGQVERVAQWLVLLATASLRRWMRASTI